MSELMYPPVTAIVRRGARLPAALRENPDAVVRAYYDAVKANGLADDVLTAASDPANPMHEYFTWDDLEAADKERLREVFSLGACFADAQTGEPIFVSTYRETNNSADAGRIHINVRLLPTAEPPITEPRLVYTVKTIEPALPAPLSYTLHAAVADMFTSEPEPPQSDVIEDPSLGVFRRWVESHKHDPSVLRAAWRILRDAL